MTPGDCARVLAAAAARDLRTIGEFDVMAWQQDIGDLDYTDALESVSRHYRQTRDRIMPADIRALCDTIDRERRKAVRQEAERRAIATEANVQRRDRSTEVATLADTAAARWTSAPLALPSRFEDDPDRAERVTDGIATARAALPGESPSALAHRRAVARARRESGRPDKPVRRSDRGTPRDPKPVAAHVAALAVRYLRDGYAAADVATRLGIDRKWCEKTARQLGNPTPVGWCGKCTYDGRIRKPTISAEAIPCPECNTDQPTEATDAQP